MFFSDIKYKNLENRSTPLFHKKFLWLKVFSSIADSTTQL